MKSVVVFDSRSGNTRLVATAVADNLKAFGSVRLVPVADASATVWDHCDLLVAGSPTESRHATPPMHAFFDRLPAHALRGIRAAAFDTRLNWPRLLSGSAAGDIERWLCELDAEIVVSPESFIVTNEPRLRPGELERVPEWANSMAEQTRHDVGLKGQPLPV